MKKFKLKDYLISILIVVVTLLYFADDFLIPDNLEVISIFGFEIGSFGFQNILHFVYYAKMKLLILFFSITWFLTCKHWWKPVILLMITIELFKLVSVFNKNTSIMDEIEYFTSLPITIPLVIILILFASKLNKYRITDEIRDNLDQEIDEIFFELNRDKMEELSELREQMENVKNLYYAKDKPTYINKLISIRDKFYKL